MKFISLLLCNFAFLFDTVLSTPFDSHDVVGVSNRKLGDYITQTIHGLRNILRTGDDDLGYGIADPYELEDRSWDHVDFTRKHELYLNSKNSTAIRGLSNFTINYVNAQAKSMSASIVLFFEHIEAEGPYNLDGFYLKKYMPTYGNGLIKLVVDGLACTVDIDLGLENSFIVVEEVKTHHVVKDWEVSVTGFMDLSSDFANLWLNDVLEEKYNLYVPELLRSWVQEKVEENIGGMTLDELFEYLDYLKASAD